jgi:Skp family chaperone for outer membrane proteins
MLKIIFSIIFINFIFISLSNSDDQIKFVNINFIINNSNAGIKVLDTIDKMKKNLIKELKEKEKKIKEKEIILKGQQNILEKKEFDKKISLLKEEINQYNIDREKAIKEIDIKQKDDLENLIKKITPLLENYMEKNSIGIIFNENSVFFSKKKYNASEDILKLVNDNIK